MKPNILRGKILTFLRHVYPEGSDGRTIVSIFYQYHRTEDISESLEYLTDKGYVAKRLVPHPYIPQETLSLYKIAPKGIDLVEGNIEEDPGITVLKEDR